MSIKETATITLYEISKCGLYKYNDASKPFLGNTQIFFEQLMSWAKNPKRNLIDTCTYEIEDDELGERTFCYEIIKNQANNFIVVTWNETTGLDGKLASINGNVPVGQASIKTKKNGKNEILGYPTYFYVVPNQNIIATVTFGTTKNGRLNFKCLVKEFISKYTKFADYKQNITDQKNDLQGYRDKSEPQSKPLNLRAMFDFNLIRSTHQIDNLISNFDQIRYVVKHNKLSVADTLKQGWSSKLSLPIFERQKPKVDGDVKFTFEYPYTPETSKELTDFILDWEKNFTGSMWDNIGFKLKGDSRTYWLNDMSARNKFDLNLEKNSQDVIDANSLLMELERLLPKILLLR